MSNTNQCDQHSAPVRKRHRGVEVTELACWSISGPRRAVGRTRTAEGQQVDARACPRTLGRVAADMRVRVLGVSAEWPSVSGRMAFGIWPCGLWTLAAWRCLICARKPVPRWCPMVVNPCGDARPTMGSSLIGCLSGLNQRRQGGPDSVVRFWIQLGWGLGFDTGSGSSTRCHPWPHALRT